MNRLIKVGTFNGANVYVNPTYVQVIGSEGQLTYIAIAHQTGFVYVQETPDHVASAINNA